MAEPRAQDPKAQPNPPEASQAVAIEVMTQNQKLLDAIVAGDWKAYQEMCDPSITAFEPEAIGHLIQGLPFHKFYFDLEKSTGPRHTTICSPHLRLLGPVAVVSYIRLTQSLGADGAPVTRGVEETRVWERKANGWKHVHFHRSPISR